MQAAARQVASRMLRGAPQRLETVSKRGFAAEPGEAPKVQYPWVDPMNPSRWKEEHIVFAVLGGWAVVIFGASKIFGGKASTEETK